MVVARAIQLLQLWSTSHLDKILPHYWKILSIQPGVPIPGTGHANCISGRKKKREQVRGGKNTTTKMLAKSHWKNLRTCLRSLHFFIWTDNCTDQKRTTDRRERLSLWLLTLLNVYQAAFIVQMYKILWLCISPAWWPMQQQEQCSPYHNSFNFIRYTYWVDSNSSIVTGAQITSCD